MVDIPEDAEGASGGDAAGILRYRFQDTGLDDGTPYHYKITAFDEKNVESDFSKPVTGTTLSGVSGFQARGDMIRQTELTWRPERSEDVGGYVIYRSEKEDGRFSKIKTIHDRDTGQYLDKAGLKDAARYFYRISILDQSGRETSPTPSVSAKTKGAPPVPAGLQASSGLVKKVDLRWPANPHKEVSGYKIYRGLEKAGTYELIATLEGRDKTAYEDTGSFGHPLGDDTGYHYLLVTFNGVGVESERRVFAFATTKARPEKPNGLKARGGLAKRVSLKWEANREPDVVHYHLYRKASGSTSFSRLEKAGPETFYEDRGLKDGKPYTYALKAEDRDGLISDLSDPATARTKPKPRQPGPATYRYEGRTVILTWPVNPEPDIVKYNLYEKGFFGAQKIGSVKRPEVQLSDLASGKKSSYVMTAVDRDGLESEPGEPITITGP